MFTASYFLLEEKNERRRGKKISGKSRFSRCTSTSLGFRSIFSFFWSFLGSFAGHSGDGWPGREKTCQGQGQMRGSLRIPLVNEAGRPHCPKCPSEIYQVNVGGPVRPDRERR